MSRKKVKPSPGASSLRYDSQASNVECGGEMRPPQPAINKISPFHGFIVLEVDLRSTLRLRAGLKA